MAILKAKRGSGVPSGLTAWEIAYDFTNGNFYIGNTAGSPILLGSSGGGGGGAVSSVTGTGAGISISPTTGAVIVENTGVKSLTNSNSLTLSGSTGAISIGINSTSITTAKVYNDTSITLNVDDGIGNTNNVVVYPSATTFSKGISLAAFSYFTAGLCAAGSTFSGSQNFVNGATFSGIVNLRSGLCASGGTFSGTQTFVNGATFSALANFTSGLCASGGITFSGQLTGVSATFSGLIISSAGFSGTGITLSGNLSAATKSFVIPHPTKKNMTLRYGSLEGPENGVYVRGKLEGTDTINLPDYWSKLIDKDSITVNLTPIKSPDIHFIKTITKSKVTVGSASGNINCFYTVYAERKDVPKLTVEY